MNRAPRALAAALLALVVACGTSVRVTHPTRPATSASSAGGAATRWDHVVVVVEENRDAVHILGSPDAPYLNRLAAAGLTLTDMHGERHPSQPNYLALLSGSTQGLTDDSCPHRYAASSLPAQLLATGRSFAGYSESLPAVGFTDCSAGPYARKHAPWTDFAGVPASVNHPLTDLPAEYGQLPDVSFVIPDLRHDMHDGTVGEGDAWLREHLDGYVTWARTHRSLLIVTWDEDERTAANHIATIAVGAGVAPGRWTARADHYALLATLEHAFGLPALAHAAGATVVTPLG